MAIKKYLVYFNVLDGSFTLNAVTFHQTTL